MKKLLLVGALALSTIAFANNTKEEAKPETKTEKKSEIKELTLEQKKAIAAYFAWWYVSYTNACGSTNTVYFQSDNPDGSPGFIKELAFAVNSSYDVC